MGYSFSPLSRGLGVTVETQGLAPCGSRLDRPPRHYAVPTSSCAQRQLTVGLGCAGQFAAVRRFPWRVISPFSETISAESPYVVGQGQKIPAKKIEAATHSDNPKVARQANLAKTLKGLR